MPDAPAAAPAADRSSMLAELRSIERGTPSPSDPPPAADPAPEAAEETTSEETAAGNEDTPDIGDEDAVEPDEVEESEPVVEPETAKRLQQVQKQEKRAREALAAQRQEFEENKARWESQNRDKLSRVEKFEAMRERARVDLSSVMEELGIPVEDYEYHAELLYRRSPKGQKDPRHKAAAERTMRDREQADRIARLEKQIEDDKKERQAAEQRAANERAATEYLGKVEKAVGADAPLVKAMLTKNPARARRLLSQTTLELAQDLDGEVPSPAAVVKALEKARREELAELGIDIPAARGTDDVSTKPTKGKAEPKSKPPGAGEKTRPQSKQQQSSEQRPARHDPEQQRREIVQAMKEGALE